MPYIELENVRVICMAKICMPLYLAYNDNMIILPFRCILDVYVFYLVVF